MAYEKGLNKIFLDMQPAYFSKKESTLNAWWSYLNKKVFSSFSMKIFQIGTISQTLQIVTKY